MILGKDFNSKAKEILKKMFDLSGGEESLRVNVKKICKALDIEKNEARNLFEYLESKDCIKIETMGGPYLYGDVSLTKKGIAKSQK